MYTIYICNFPPTSHFYGYCPASSLSSIQCCGCMDQFQLSLRLQVFLKYFCVFETCTLEHIAASPSFLTVSSPPEAAFLLAPEPQVTGKQAVFFRDVPRRLPAGPALPFSCNRPHRARGCWEQTRRSLVSVTRWATSERRHPLHSYQAISWLLAAREVRGDWTACPSLLQIQARSLTLIAPWVPVKNNHNLSVAYFSNTGNRRSQNYSNKCYEVLFPSRHAEKESK